jgi:predicted membrane channel-forming protein YqfA (hemolysin III family)
LFLKIDILISKKFLYLVIYFLSILVRGENMKEKIGKTLMLVGIVISLVGFVLYVFDQEEDEEVIQIKELIKEADKIIKQSKG